MKLLSYISVIIRARFPVWMTQIKTIYKKHGFLILIKRGFRKVYRVVFFGGEPGNMHRFQYENWMKNIEAMYLNKKSMKRYNKSLKSKPKFSIIFPVWNKSTDLLSKALDSILGQVYENWEICISDGSTKDVEKMREFLKQFKTDHADKVKLVFLKDPEAINIIENSNNALALAEGAYCVFMDCDDELSKNCLLELAMELEQNPDLDFIYSDFDKINLKSNRFDPSFWSDWSPHTMLSMMYTTHVTCYKRSILKRLNGLRKGTEGAQDWDLVLRLGEITSRIAHIPKILYHWRVYSGSTALPNSGAKDWVFENQKKVLADWLYRNKKQGRVIEGAFEGSWRVKFNIVKNPGVSIVIPFKDKVEYIKRCVQSIKDKTQYENYEIVLVDNNSEEPETQMYLDSLKDCRILKYEKPFHFGKLYNWASQQVDCDHLLMLNNDIKVINKGWLEAMLEYSQQKDIGVVGAKLVYPNDRIQHAGIIVGMGGAAAHAHRMMKRDSLGYNGWLVNVRNVTAVSAACLMIKNEQFQEIGGFDEQFDPAYQDVDLGIRLHEKGYWNVFTPYAQLFHYESVTRFDDEVREGLVEDSVNGAKLRKKWPQYVGIGYGNDPFFNPNLSYSHEDFRLLEYYEPKMCYWERS